MNDPNVQRLIGALEAQARAFETALQHLHNDMAALRAEVEELNQKLAAIEGGRRMFLALLAGAGALGGTIVAIVSAAIGKIAP